MRVRSIFSQVDKIIVNYIKINNWGLHALSCTMIHGLKIYTKTMISINFFLQATKNWC